MIEVQLGDVLGSRVCPYLLVRGVSHGELDDLARLCLKLGLDTIVPNVIESFRANSVKGVPSASRSVVLVALRLHPPPSETRSVGSLSPFP